ncbi:MAG TPA: aldose 1-epimerase [Pyrinomonadaceae bacterium]|nr:aldose 1-epimerase [Pyrinomonadaceae bacterium]
MSIEKEGQTAGVEVVTLQRPRPSDSSKPVFTGAQILPNRGMMVLQIVAHIPELGETNLLEAPSLDRTRQIFSEGEDDYMGNKSFAFGGAILLPYANRIRGYPSSDRKSIETKILSTMVRLPANGGGKAIGAEQFAIHGLILKSDVEEVCKTSTVPEDRVTAYLSAGNFGGHWLSATDVWFEIILRSDAFILSVTAKNTGRETLPVGIGWHPYFSLPSGKREQARLRIPAHKRVMVNNYDEVLPTGELSSVAGTAYDFLIPGGRSLGDLFLDDCFVALEKTAEGHTVAEIVDPEASYGVRIVATSPQVSAIQVYSLQSEPYVVLEPQFNWADPYGEQWSHKSDTGMVILQPNEEVVYSTRLELFTP